MLPYGVGVCNNARIFKRIVDASRRGADPYRDNANTVHVFPHSSHKNH